MTHHCLDLFAGLGGFSAAFADSSDWDATTVDIAERFEPDIQADVLDLRPGDLPDADVVLASPPCTVFSTAGNHDLWDFDTREPIGEPAHEHVTLAYHTVGLIRGLAPDYWFLENPFGRLRWFLGDPAGKVTYCQYGRDYMKRTDLWGKHPPMTYRHCAREGPCHTKNREYDGTSATRLLGETAEERAKVPYELSEAIREAVENAYANPPPEQTTLVDGDTGPPVAADGGES